MDGARGTLAVRGGGGRDFARGKLRQENFGFPIGDEIFPQNFFAQIDNWLAVTMIGCLACPISGCLGMVCFLDFLKCYLPMVSVF